MTEQLERPTPLEAAAALASIADMKQVALNSGLPSRWFAVSISCWVGAMTVAKAYNGPAVDTGIAALLVGGLLGIGLWRRRLIARLRAVYSLIGTLGAVALFTGVLVILVVGDRAFEVHAVSWAPFATGGAVAAVLLMAFELERRSGANRAARDA